MTYPHPACMEPDGGEGPCAGYQALAAEARNLHAELDRVKGDARWVTDAMVTRALQGFDTGTGDPNDYRKRMRAALEAAIINPT